MVPEYRRGDGTGVEERRWERSRGEEMGTE
jgi:hypothetical protein